MSSDVRECELVYRIIAICETRLRGGYTSDITRTDYEDFLLHNGQLKDCFGRFIIEYSDREINDLIAEHILLNGEVDDGE